MTTGCRIPARVPGRSSAMPQQMRRQGGCRPVRTVVGVSPVDAQTARQSASTRARDRTATRLGVPDGYGGGRATDRPQHPDIAVCRAPPRLRRRPVQRSENQPLSGHLKRLLSSTCPSWATSEVGRAPRHRRLKAESIPAARGVKVMQAGCVRQQTSRTVLRRTHGNQTTRLARHPRRRPAPRRRRRGPCGKHRGARPPREDAGLRGRRHPVAATRGARGRDRARQGAAPRPRGPHRRDGRGRHDGDRVEVEGARALRRGRGRAGCRADRAQSRTRRRRPTS